MSRSDFRSLIDRGRKAGLNTTELYSAMGGHRLTRQDLQAGATDGNGFTAGIDVTGHATYQQEPFSREG